MRQAGRYLPEYRKTRQQAGSFLDLCYSPELAAEVTLQPLRRYDLDAAIVFADILVVPHAMGNGLKFVEGEGPVLEVVGAKSDLDRLHNGFKSEQFKSVGATLAKVRSQLGKSQSLIGFCGAPWTVASYMIEGKGSERKNARRVAYEREGWLLELIDRLVESSIEYLCLQIEAGADAVQIFDSWAGELTDELFAEFSVAPIRRIIAGVKARHGATPVIVFAKGAGWRHRSILLETGCQAIGVEAECSLAHLRADLPQGSVLQGNLDPLVLLCSDEIVKKHVALLAGSIPKNFHVFNLGHGILPQTKPEVLSVVVDELRRLDND